MAAVAVTPTRRRARVPDWPWRLRATIHIGEGRSQETIANIGAEGGTRTHTGREPQRCLSWPGGVPTRARGSRITLLRKGFQLGLVPAAGVPRAAIPAHTATKWPQDGHRSTLLDPCRDDRSSRILGLTVLVHTRTAAPRWTAARSLDASLSQAVLARLFCRMILMALTVGFSPPPGDAPASEDVFGSHAPIADAIHEVVTTEAGGRTIGLEGSWGSGKSTVVRLLAKRLEGPEARVLLFDAWAHEGDPLRRAFLDKLITSLLPTGWVDKRAWSDRREELAHRRSVEHTRPVPRLETPAILIAALTALFAILLSAGAVLLELGYASGANWPSWPGWVIYGVLIGGVVVGAAVLARLRALGNASDQWLSLFSVESVTESRSETTETPDPTSVEFEATFKGLMLEALGANRTRRLVLVVDNLDRVAPEDARSIWSTLQTFPHHSHDDRPSWLESLWVLLPYDRSGIARLWGESDKANGARTDAQQDLVGSFIDKSIQVEFEVPLPLLSDWRAYLESTLGLALPDCSEADGYTAHRMYAREVANTGRPPSPREIKQYVNRIGALHRRWQHELPFVSLAYYASLGASGIKVADRLRRDELPQPLLAGLLPDEIDAHLAAIAFNTDPVRARQLLYGPLIERALGRETSEDLLELVERPGLWEALPQTPVLLVGLGTQALLRAASRLSDVPEERRPESEWSEVTSLVTRQGLAVEDWPAVSRESADDLVALLSLLDTTVAAEIAGRVAATELADEGAPGWAEGAHELLGRFEWLALRASGPPEVVCNVLAHFVSLEGWEERVPRLRIEPSARAGLDDAIVERIADTPSDAVGALSVLRRIEPSVEWRPFADAALSRLRNGAPSQGVEPQPTPRESRALLRILRMARDGSPEDRAALVNEGVALEYVWLANQEGARLALGDWLYEGFQRFSPESWASRSYPGYAPSGKELVDALLSDPANQPSAALAGAIARRRDFDVIVSIGAHAEGAALASALVMDLWESDGFRGALSGSRFRSLWPHISHAGASGGLNLDELVRVTCARPTFVTELESAAFADDRMGMYGAIIATHPDRGEAAGLARWVAESLSNLTTDQWQVAMADSDDWAVLLAAIHDAAPSVRIRGAYAQALARFLQQAQTGAKSRPKKPSSGGSVWFRCSGPPWREPISKGLPERRPMLEARCRRRSSPWSGTL